MATRKSRKGRGNASNGLHLEELEPRLLLSADPVGAFLPDAFEPHQMVTEVLIDENLEPINQLLDTAETEDERLELVFVDSDTPDYQQLLDDLLTERNDGRRIDVIVLDNTSDGISQISQTLESHQAVDAIHLISHGSDGSLDLGSTRLASDNIAQYQQQLEGWSASLGADADILIYGCNFAADAQGQSLVERLAVLTGADIAASENLTGSSGRGGDWELEYHSGAIETSIAVSQDSRLNWNGLLDITTGLVGHWTLDVDGTDDSGNGLDGVVAGDANIDTGAGGSPAGGGRLALDGSGDYLDLSDPATATTLGSLSQGTISGWVNTSMTTGTQTIFSVAEYADNFSFATFGISEGRVFFDVAEKGFVNGWTLSAATNATVADGNWHHVAITVDSSGNTFYIDGAEIAAGDINYIGGNASSSGFLDTVVIVDSVAIGATAESGAYVYDFNGDVDDVRVYDRALSASDITELYNDVNAPPVITSDGGGDTASVNVVENTTAVTTVTATDADFDAPIYSIDLASDDAAFFNIDSGTGVLTFAAAPDYETTADLDGNNIHEVTVQVGDGNGGVDTQAISVTVSDITSALLVTTNVDTNDGDTSSIEALVASKGADGQISFREAILAANNTAGASTINLPAGTYNLTGGELSVTSDLTIVGADAGTTIINANSADRVFYISAGSLTLSDATVTGGAADRGAGFKVDLGATLNLSRAVVSNNVTTGAGGGFYSMGTVIADQVRITSNQADLGGGFTNAGSATITNSLIDGNTAAFGGGIRTTGNGTDLTLENVTISGNTGTILAGGIQNSKLATLTNVTITDNHAAQGGGIAVGSGSVSTFLVNTIVAGNTELDGTTPNEIDGNIDSQGNNLIGDSTGGGGWVGSDQLDVDPLLGALADNGGPTLTHALLTGSTAINGGTNTGAPATDQRGTTRDATTDIGAYEYVPAANSNPVISSNGGGDPANINVTENTTAVTTVTATDADLDTLNYSLDPASDDDGFFSINSTSGELTFAAAPDFEIPADLNGDNVYKVTVQVSDGNGGVDTQAISVTVTDALELVVTNTNATGAGSLHEAILNANANSGVTDTISFNISGAGPHTILVDAGGLPVITDTVIIDGTTDPDYAGKPVIELDGTNAAVDIDGFNIAASASGSSIKGFVINNFTGLYGSGIEINGATQVTISDNYIGTDATGEVALGMGAYGAIHLNNANDNTISGNVISGNDRSGIWVTGSSDNTIQGNFIGTDPTGSINVGNQGSGISFSGSYSGNLIGGVDPGNGNVIAFNDSEGITFANSGTGNAVLGNLFFSNGDLAIDLKDDNSVTANDAGDADTGSNNLQNFPVLDNAATTGGGSITLQGKLHSNAGITYRIEFFASSAQDPLGHGEAARFLGAASVTTDASGDISFTESFSELVAVGEYVTATATVDLGGGSYGDTSEFAANVQAVSSNSAPIVLAVESPASATTNEDTAFVYSGANVVQVDDGIPADTYLQVSLFVANGTLTLSGITGLSFPGGSNGSSGMVIEGLESDINAALDGLVFTPDGDFNGADNLSITVALSANLEGHYTFESGDATDASVGVLQNGTLNGDATVITDGTRGEVISLDGSGDSVSISGMFGNSADVTLATWINLDATDTWADIISLGDNVFIRQEPGAGNGLQGYFHDGTTWHTVSYATELSGTGWRHVAYTFDDVANEQKLYVDGVEVAQASQSASISYTQGTDTFIGQYGNGSGWESDAEFDDVRIYSRALSASEIAAIAAGNASTTKNVAITVDPVNDLVENTAPTAVDDAFNVDEDTPSTIDLLVNDTDPENDTLTLLGFERIVARYDAGTSGAAIDPTSVAGGSWSFEDTEDSNAATGNLQAGGVSPDGATGVNGWNVTDSSDTFGENLWYSTTLSGTDTALADANGWSLSAEIRMVDDFGDTRTTFMRYGDGTTRFLAYFDLDSNGDLTVELIDDGGNQVITLTSGGNGSTEYHNFEIVYDPIAATAMFLTDGVRVDNGSWAGETSVNTGVRWGMGSGGGQGSANYHSIEMKVFDQSITTTNGATVANNGDGTVNYSPASNFNGADTFSYTIRDSEGHLASATVNVTVDAVNDAPVITSDGGGDTANINVAENTTAVTTVTATDADLDTLTYSLDPASDDDGFFTIDSGSGVLSFASAPNFEVPADSNGDNIYEVTVQVNDGNGGVDTQAISVTVTDALELVVTNTNASGTGSLHEAILNANANSGVTDTITFNISGVGPHTILVDAGGLPVITDTVIIDGTTDPDYVGTPIIELDGSSAGAGMNGLTLNAGSDGSLIRGLVINRFDQSGILIDGSDGNTISGNYIGTDSSGNVQSGSDVQATGIIIDASSGNTIGGTDPSDANVLSGNRLRGVLIAGSTSANNVVAGNFIGTNSDGSAALTNVGVGQQIGVYLYDTPDNTIGGTAPGAENIISGNLTSGIYVWGPNSSGNDFVGNTIGLDATGTVDLGNGGTGILITGGATGNTIGGGTAAHRNVISGNDSHGIEISGATTTGNAIEGNYIGTNATGMAEVRNEGNGIRLSSNTGTTVGGTVTGMGNVISGNNNSGTTADGIYISGGSGHTVQGNYIGLASDGSTVIGNYSSGVAISGSSNNQIGGTTAAARNVISGNTNGVMIAGVSSLNTVIGNYIGTDATGLLDRGNSADGVVLSAGAQNNTIGGATVNYRNIISGNDNDGIWITGAGTSNNVVQGNWIGLDAAGGAMGNTFHGIGIENGASDNLVGGTNSGEGNAIGNNIWDGITIAGSGTGNSVLANEIFENGNLGIDLADDDVTANDPDDLDAGANNLQNFPVISSTNLSGSNLTLSGSLDTDGANTDYRIEFFGGGAVARDATNGEGRIYLGFVNISTDVNGVGSFTNVVLTGVTLSGGDYVTATATRIDDMAQVAVNDRLAYGDTSEFAVNVAIVGNSVPVITSLGGGDTADVSLAEKTKIVTVVAATDGDLDTLTYSLDLSSTDVAMFKIDAVSGELAFAAETNFEIPADQDGDNVYEVTVQVSDGNGGMDTQDISVTVTDINEAPTVGGASLPSVLEDTTDPAGRAIGDMFSGSFNDVDAGSSMSGILVTNNPENAAQGVWQYSTNSGSTWNDVGTIAYPQSLALDVTSLVRFVPTADYNGSVSILSLRALDNTYAGGFTSGATKVTADASSPGGSSSISSSLVSIGTSVTAVNDAPVRAAGTVGNLTVLQDSGFTSLVLGGVTYGPGGGADENSQTLTYEVTTIPDGTAFGSVFLADGITQVTTGFYTLAEVQGMQFKPAVGESGGPSFFTYRVKDSGGGTDTVTETIQLNITPVVNQAPVLSNGGSLSYSEHSGSAPFTVSTLTDVDSIDLDGGVLAFTIASGGYSTDTLQLSGFSGVSVTGNDVYVSGVLVGTQAGGTGGTPFTVTFNSSATPSRVQSVYQALSILNSSDTPITGIRNLEVTVTDGDGGTSNTATATANLTTASNDAPTFGSTLDGTPTFTEGGAAVVLDNDVQVFDAELDAAGNYAGASLTLNRNMGAVGDDVFSASGNLAALTQGGDLTLFGLKIGTVTINSGGMLGLLFDSNASAAAVNETLQSIAYSNVSEAPPGTVQIDWSFDDGNAGSQGSGGALQASGSTVVSIVAVNDAPTAVIVPSSFGVTEDDSYRGLFGLSVSDVDADTADIEVTLSVLNGQLRLGSTTGLTITAGANESLTVTVRGSITDLNAALTTLAYRPDADFDATETLTLAVSDLGNSGTGGALTDSDTVNIIVSPVNDAPTGVVSIDNMSPSEGDELTASNTLVDKEGLGSIVYTWKSDGGVVGTGTAYTTQQSDVGKVITVEASYTDGGGTVETVVSGATAPVSNVDQSAVITGNSSFSGNEGDTPSGDLNATDVDGLTDTTYFTISSQGANGTASINAETGGWSFAPTDANWFGSDSFEVTVTDDEGGTTTQTVSITLANVEDEAVITGNISYSGNEGDTPTGDLNATDVDGLIDTTYFSISSQGANGTASINAETGGWSFAPTDANWFGSDSFEVTVTDDEGGTTTQTVSITLANVEDEAVITGNTSYSGNEGDTPSGDLNATDVDGLTDTTYFSISSQGANGTASINAETGGWTFAPTDANWLGSDSFEVTVTDDEGGTTTQTVSITLANIEDGSIITGDVSYSGNEGDTPSGDLNATDIDGLTDTTYFSISSQGANGTASIDAETGGWTFTPTDPNWFGSDSFEVLVTDDLGGVTTQLISIALNRLNDAPTGSVVLSGLPEEEQVLTATNTLNDTDGIGIISYQWQSNGEDIVGAVGESYSLTQADVGATISVVASYTDNGGTLESVSSKALGPILNSNDLPSGKPVIMGIPEAGETLLAETSGITDQDGLGALSYAWQRSTDGGLSWVDVGNDTSYTLTDSDVGADVRVQVTYTDAGATSEALLSDRVVPISAELPIDPPVELPGGSIPSPAPDANEPEPGENPGSAGPAPSDEAGPPSNKLPSTEDETSGGTADETGDGADTSKNRIPGSTRGNPQPQAIPETILALIEAGAEAGAGADLAEVEQPATAPVTGEPEKITESELEYAASSSAANMEMLYVEKVLDNPDMWRGIDSMKQEMDQSEETTEAFVVEMVSTTGAGLMAGLVAYALRGGALMASLLSTMPMMQAYDPLPILAAKKKKPKRNKDKNPIPNKGDSAAEVDALFE